jgi:predicted MPP superfamily phosphohydrolase
MNWPFVIFHAVAVAISLTAAACVYLFVLNRVLIQIRDNRHKSWLIRAGGLVSVALGGILGYFAAGTPWLLVPVIVLLIAALGEIRRLLIRWRCRGAPPIAVENGGVAWRQPNTTTDLAVFRYKIEVPAWRGTTLRIAHVSDFHVNSHLPLAYFSDAMLRVAAAQPDLVFMTGDFVTDPQYVNLLPDVLSLARGRLGTFGILGNHDDWAGRDAVAAAVRSAGVTLLGNEGVRVDTGNGAGLAVHGCEEPWTPSRWQAPAPEPGQLALVLTHTPDNVYRLSRHGFAAIFAGHFHGGQMRIPRLGALVVPSSYGRRFDHGHFVLHGTHLFVTAGVGSAEPPLRLWCQPDVFIVDIAGQHG